MNKNIAELQAKLNPYAQRPFGGGAFMVGDNPGAMAAEARRELAEIESRKKNVDCSPERKARIESTLSVPWVA